MHYPSILLNFAEVAADRAIFTRQPHDTEINRRAAINFGVISENKKGRGATFEIVPARARADRKVFLSVERGNRTAFIRENLENLGRWTDGHGWNKCYQDGISSYSESHTNPKRVILHILSRVSLISTPNEMKSTAIKASITPHT